MIEQKDTMKRLVKYKKYSVYAVGTIILLTFCFGFFAGTYVQQNNFKKFVRAFKNIRTGNENYSFISPLIGVVSAPATDIGIFTDVKNKIKKYLESEKSKGNLYDYSIYVRDLNSPLWFGVNEEASFFPASLYKLPIATAVYKQAENDPSFLKKRIVYTNEMSIMNKSVAENEESKLVVGKDYSVVELTQMMLESSDNGAKDLLVSVVEMKYTKNLFDVMKIAYPTLVTGYEISSRKYALFLRLLYNSSYLNEEDSELILSYLSKSTFKEGLVAGVPKDIQVAHKFGTYHITDNIDGVQKLVEELHDCGIVYHMEHPYVICIMTKGKDSEVLIKIISHISRLVFEEQDNKEKY